jgi:cytochrome P450
MSHSQLWAIGTIAIMPDIQRRTYESLVQSKPMDSQESQSAYIIALSKEVHRFYDAFRIAPPRETVKDLAWRGHFIPAGTTIFLNSFAVNRGMLLLICFVPAIHVMC